MNYSRCYLTLSMNMLYRVIYLTLYTLYPNNSGKISFDFLWVVFVVTWSLHQRTGVVYQYLNIPNINGDKPKMKIKLECFIPNTEIIILDFFIFHHKNCKPILLVLIQIWTEFPCITCWYNSVWILKRISSIFNKTVELRPHSSVTHYNIFTKLIYFMLEVIYI